MKLQRLTPASLRQTKVIQKINWFIAQPYYVGLVALLTLLSSVFSLEIPVYFCFIAIGIYIALFAEDLLGLMPLVLNAYITVSKQNNPGNNLTTIFDPDRWGVCFLAMVILWFAVVVVRLCTDPEIGGKKFLTKKRQLLPSILILGVAYCLGGLGSGADMKKNLLFAALQFATIFIPYFLFSGGIRWEKCRRDYFGWIGFCTGLVLLCQLANIYRINDVVVDGVIDREQIFNGWSTYNNFGMLLAMMIPSAFYLASRHNKGWLGSVIACVFLAGTVLSCSRNAILMGSCIFVVCVFVALSFAKNKKANFYAIVVLLVLAGVMYLAFYQEIRKMFDILFDMGADNNSRYMTWREGLKQFKKHPVFGATFYPQYWLPFDWSVMDKFTDFFPPRWHNTIVQMLASCGIVGLVAYLFHRVQTIKVFLFDRTREKAFIACMILTLLGGSLLDCHFFNIGPVLFYSAGLAFAEFCVKRK